MPTILIADDNSNIQKMVSLALKGEGIDVVAVGNGEAAVRKLKEILPDVVLADIFMPVRNGYEVCDFVKHEPRLANVPVVLLTGAFDPFDEHEAQRVGADGVLKKPFVPPDPLVNLVKQLIARGSADQLVGVAAGGKTSTSATSQAAPPLAKSPVTSIDGGGGSAQKISQMVETFGEVLPTAQNSAAPMVEEEDTTEALIAERTTRVAFEELMAPTRDPIGTPKPADGFGGFAAFPDLVDVPTPAEPPATPGAITDDDWVPTGDATAPEPESFWPPRSSMPAQAIDEADKVATQQAAHDDVAEVENSATASDTPSPKHTEETPAAGETKSLPNYPWQSIAQESEADEQPADQSGYYSGARPDPADPDPANGVEPGLVPTSREGSGDPAEAVAPVTAGDDAAPHSHGGSTSSDASSGSVPVRDDPFAIPADAELEPIAEETPAQVVPFSSTNAPMDSASTDSSAAEAQPPSNPTEAMNAIGREMKELASSETGLTQEEIVARVASRVIEKMLPQVLEMITREVLKPIVEAMVRREVEGQ